MKKILAFILCIVLAVSVFAGCTPAEQTPAETTAAAFDPAKLTINGVALKEYTIVFSSVEGQFSERRNNNSLIESAKLADVAELFSDMLFELTGVRVHAVSDKAEEAEYEIIIGKADRKAALNYYKTSSWTKEKYAYGVFENKLILAGGSANACYFAAEEFLKDCQAMTGSDFTAEMVKGNAELIEVACVGDSITDGAGKIDDETNNDRNVHSYPIYLQRLLGYKYYVGNYGYSAKMMLDYGITNNFFQSLEAKPDVLIMMLGTNDSNASKNPDAGTEVGEKNHKDAADSLLSKYKSANPDVQIYIMTMPSILPGGEARKQVCAKYAEYNRQIAAENGYYLIDMWEASEKAQWVFIDGIHPQGEVYGELAKVVYDGLKDTIVK